LVSLKFAKKENDYQSSKKVAKRTMKVGNTCPMSATDDLAKAGG